MGRTGCGGSCGGGADDALGTEARVVSEARGGVGESRVGGGEPLEGLLRPLRPVAVGVELRQAARDEGGGGGGGSEGAEEVVEVVGVAVEEEEG